MNDSFCDEGYHAGWREAQGQGTGDNSEAIDAISRAVHAVDAKAHPPVTRELSVAGADEQHGEGSIPCDTLV